MSTTFLTTLLAFSLSAAAVQLQSGNSAFASAGIQGCISAAENADGEALVIHDCNTEALANQDFSLSFFTKQNSGPQPIKVFGNKCIDVVGGVNADGTKLQIWTCDAANKNQQWISVNDFTLQWSGTNKCIDLTDGKSPTATSSRFTLARPTTATRSGSARTNPDNIDPTASPPPPTRTAPRSPIVDCQNKTDFQATFPAGNITWTSPVAPLTAQLKTFTNKCLDVPGGSTANGVKLQIWTCAAGNTNQLFKRDGLKIVWSGKNKCLDLTGGNSTAGNAIQLWDCSADNSNLNQIWFSGFTS
ncbi:ricin B lectin domain-containing protein [Mycena filopes]|nr:ricin B lectin domain-containing protein [Mycena filopes]